MKLSHRFQTRKLDWAKVEDTQTKALTEDRGLDEDGTNLSACPALYILYFSAEL